MAGDQAGDIVGDALIGDGRVQRHPVAIAKVQRLEPSGQALLLGNGKPALAGGHIKRKVLPFDHRLFDAVERMVRRMAGRVARAEAETERKDEGDRGGGSAGDGHIDHLPHLMLKPGVAVSASAWPLAGVAWPISGAVSVSSPARGIGRPPPVTPLCSRFSRNCSTAVGLL